ncbi:J domain-containing protein [Halovivax limisalsi]|uniref:J domain-containing protein n=1 Tax=Halovivax limisalsi TaxID=1453760 RepID=UPI001FFCD1D6|nr:J domain-containing protein [Halovivax limisalsi]
MDRDYETLGISPDASIEEVRRQYRRLLKEHHPDHGGSRERFLRIKRAYEEITGESPPPTRRSALRSSFPATSADPTFVRDDADPVRTRLSVDGEYLSLSLVSMRQSLELSTIVSSPAVAPDVERPVAFFEATNNSDDALSWAAWTETTFVGTDGFMYQGSSILREQAGQFPGHWWPRKATLEPGRTLRAVVVAADLPAGVDVDRIVYTQRGPAVDGSERATERYLFAVSEADDSIPFAPDAAGGPR